MKNDAGEAVTAVLPKTEATSARGPFRTMLIILGVLSLMALPSGAQPYTLVVPREMETMFGSSSEVPLFTTFFEVVYAASEFADLPADVILITDIAFRIDEKEQTYTNFAGGLVMQMNVFRGSLEEIAERKSGRQEPIVTVFEPEGDIAIPGVPG